MLCVFYCPLIFLSVLLSDELLISMRVLESKTSQAYSMGKRKHKLRKQNKDNEQCPSDSSDEGALAAATGKA